MPDSIENVPSEDVGKVVQAFIDGGAKEVTAKEQPADGKWTVTGR